MDNNALQKSNDKSSHTALSTETGKGGTQADVSKLREFVRLQTPAIGMLAVILIGGALRPAFFIPSNLFGVLEQSAVLVFMSIGLAIVMSLRGVDLSVAQIADGSALMAAALLLHGYPAWLAILIPVVAGMVIGILNGLVMGYLGFPAIIGTLGMMFVIRSGELIYSRGGEPQILFTLPANIKATFEFLGQGQFGPIPVAAVFCLIVVLIMIFLTKSTVAGRRIDAVGENARAAFLSGVNVKRVFAGGFVLSGILASLSGVVLASWQSLATPRAVEPYLLDAFVAVYLGSLISRTGKMNVLGTVLGALFVGFVDNELTLLGLGASNQYIMNGVFVLLAMAVGAVRRKAD